MQIIFASETLSRKAVVHLTKIKPIFMMEELPRVQFPVFNGGCHSIALSWLFPKIHRSKQSKVPSCAV